MDGQALWDDAMRCYDPSSYWARFDAMVREAHPDFVPPWRSRVERHNGASSDSSGGEAAREVKRRRVALTPQTGGGAPCKPSSAAVVWMHSAGGPSDVWAKAQREWQRVLAHVRFHNPEAPPAARESGSRDWLLGKPSWFDGRCVTKDGPATCEALDTVRRSLEDIARDGSARVVLAGVSQGGAMALQAALQLTYSLPAGVDIVGVLGISAWLPPQLLSPGTLPEGSGAGVRTMPFRLVHARQDAVVPIARMSEAAETLRAAGMCVTASEFDVPGGHSRVGFTPAVKESIGAWLMELLPPPPPLHPKATTLPEEFDDACRHGALA